MDELIVDNFAGGGGASTGIEMALGRSPDYAVNHDEVALAMHEVNHPDTVHLCTSVWKVDPDDIDGNIGLGWFSPDCKHFSKAKGGKPVEKNIRDLAWVVVRWARRRKGRPRVIILENVEEFSTWGPLGADGKPDPERRGFEFNKWMRELRRLRYKVEYRELRACDYGAPTIRKRLFLIARRDGKPIVWPQPTHGDPKKIAAAKAALASGDRRRQTVFDAQLQPWRTAAEIIDWSLPCPSIFATSEEIMAEYGIRAIRPLKPATMARTAKGVKRYVLDAAKPFIVNLTHHGGERTESVEEPFMTVTGAHRGEKALVTPYLARTAHGEVDKNGKRRGQGTHTLEEPFSTVLASPDHALVAPIITGVGGRMGQTEPRTADAPAQTLTAKADSVVVAPYLTKFRANSVGSALDEPAPTVTANSFIQRPGGAAPIGLVAPHLMTMRNAQKPFNGGDEPSHTVTSGGARLHLVAAFLAQHNIDGRNGEGNPGRSAEEPVSTVLQTGSHQGVVGAHLVRQFGTAVGASLDDPAKTVMSDGGGGKTQLAATFMSKYYGTGEGQVRDDPAHTVTTKDRLGLVTVMIEGEPYVISDIGMRMLSPRELFRAQGFPDSYIIDRAPDGKPISKTDQVSKCGNSVCPPMAAALVAANCGDMARVREAAE